ncbi:MAG TPA: SpoIID/LytB domain-containing protein, partial [Planctomycetota bacterium]|nr:SpoIID/LytB domain-containing protein [Planctomycetota bacterium]
RVRVRVLEPGRGARLKDVRAPGDSGGAVDLALRNVGGVLQVDGAARTLPARFVAADASTFGLDEQRYYGDVIAVKEPNDASILLVNRLPLDRYLEGVVLSEMSPRFPEEALKAQAVASRSYAVYKLLSGKNRLYDVTDNQRSQVYKGDGRGRATARSIVAATRGLGMLYDGRVVEGVFSSTCGGSTRPAAEAFGDAAPAPLSGVVCGHCVEGEFATWTVKTKRAAVGRALGLGGAITAIEDEARLPSGRLGGVTFRSAKGQKRVAGHELRNLLGDRALSTWFTRLALEGDQLVAEGRGYGHGVGLCQVGARTLANAGLDFAGILAYYYPGAVVAPLFPLES